MIKKTSLEFDIKQVLDDLRFINEKHPFHPTSLQVGITHRPAITDSKEKVYDAIGSLWDEKKQVYLKNESDFTIFNKDFSHLYVHEVYKNLQNSIDLQLGRVRFMLRKPHTCYSLHIDDDLRYHLVLTTNEGCYMFFKDGGSDHMPADGFIYEFDGEKTHTAFNAGSTDRIHLVFGTFKN